MANLVQQVTGATEIKAIIARVPQAARGRGLYLAIGEEVKGQTERRFDLSMAPDGSRWKQSLRVTLGLGGGPTLVKSGDMRRSLTVNADDQGGELVIPKAYAATHQFGATIKPVRAKTLRFALGRKGNRTNFVFARSVTIPKREMLGFSAENVADIATVARDHILDVARGARP